jgi:predicted transcriptional regulator
MRPVLDQSLRRAIKDSGLSDNELARRTGVPQPTISRFLAGADMKLATAAKIAAYLGLSLRKG